MDPTRELNNGSLFENFVAQEIYAGSDESYYYKKNLSAYIWPVSLLPETGIQISSSQPSLNDR